MITPDNWTDSDREEVVVELARSILNTVSRDEARKIVFDALYEDLIWQEWADLWSLAEDYAPHLLDRFRD